MNYKLQVEKNLKELRDRRKAVKMTGIQAGLHLGVTRGHYFKLETGRAEMSFKQYTNICEQVTFLENQK